MNARKLGHGPLRQFIAQLYYKKFGKGQPDVVRSSEEKVEHNHQVKARKHQRKFQRRKASDNPQCEMSLFEKTT